MSVRKGRHREEELISKPFSRSGNMLVWLWKMLPGEFVAYFLLLLSFFWYVFRVLILLLFAAPSPFSLSCPKVHPHHLLPSSPPPLFTHSTFSLLQPSWVPVSRLLPFYPHSLHTPHLPSLSINAGRPFFTPTTSSTLYSASALFSQANHAEMQCNCANVSYPSLSLSTLQRACLSVSSERLLHYEKCLGWFTNETFHFKFKDPLVLDRHPHAVAHFGISFKGL